MPVETTSPEHRQRPMPRLSEQIIPRRKLVLLVSETAIFTGVLLFGTSSWPLAGAGFDLFSLPVPGVLRTILTCVTVAVICQAALSYNDLYDWKVSQNRADLPNRLLHSLGYALVMLALLVFVAPGLFYFPGLAETGAGLTEWKLMLLLALSFLAVYGWRAGFHWFFYKWRFGEQLLVLGNCEEARNLANLVHDNPMAGFEVVGLVGSGDNGADVPAHLRILGPEEQLAEIAENHSVSRVVVALPERRGRVPVDQLLDCRMAGILVEERESMYERITGKVAVESMRPSYMIFGRGFMKAPLSVACKRVFDILASLAGLTLSLPIIAVAAILIKVSSRGPVLFKQTRVGQDGKIFRLVKFRTMYQDAEKESGPTWAIPNDTRITWVGRLLRPSRVDEIPQFLNILAGQMSFVGPRPERPYFVEDLSNEIPFYPMRHAVKPGLTGWAQVNHSYGGSVDDAMEKLRYDLYYIKNMGPLLDLSVILRTVGVILSVKGAR